MRKIYQSHLFDDKNAFRKSVYLYEKNYFPDFSCRHRRMCVYGRYAPGFLNLVDQSYNLVLIPFAIKSKASKYKICYSLVQFLENVCQIVLYQCTFLALQGFKLTWEVKKLALTTYLLKSKGELRGAHRPLWTQYFRWCKSPFVFNFRPKSGGASTPTALY